MDRQSTWTFETSLLGYGEDLVHKGEALISGVRARPLSPTQEIGRGTADRFSASKLMRSSANVILSSSDADVARERRTYSSFGFLSAGGGAAAAAAFGAGGGKGGSGSSSVDGVSSTTSSIEAARLATIGDCFGIRSLGALLLIARLTGAPAPPPPALWSSYIALSEKMP